MFSFISVENELSNRWFLDKDGQMDNDLPREAVVPRVEMWASNATRPTGNWMTTELLNLLSPSHIYLHRLDLSWAYT